MVAIYQIWFLATRRIPCFAPWAIPRYNGWLILPLATASPWIRHEMSKTLIFVFCDTILMLQQLLSIFVQSNEIRWICLLEWLETSAFISCNKCGVQWTPHLEASRCGYWAYFWIQLQHWGWMIELVEWLELLSGILWQIGGCVDWGVCISAGHEGRDCPVRSLPPLPPPLPAHLPIIMLRHLKPVHFS